MERVTGTAGNVVEWVAKTEAALWAGVALVEMGLETAVRAAEMLGVEAWVVVMVAAVMAAAALVA